MDTNSIKSTNELQSYVSNNTFSPLPLPEFDRDVLELKLDLNPFLVLNLDQLNDLKEPEPKLISKPTIGIFNNKKLFDKVMIKAYQDFLQGDTNKLLHPSDNKISDEENKNTDNINLVNYDAMQIKPVYIIMVAQDIQMLDIFMVFSKRLITFYKYLIVDNV